MRKQSYNGCCNITKIRDKDGIVMRFVQNGEYVTNHEIRFPALVTGECKIIRCKDC